MLERILAVLFLLTALSGCASAQPKQGRIAWDGLGRDPNLSAPTKHRVASVPVARDPNIERESVLATMRPYSEAWWVVHDEIETEKDRQIGRKLVICEGCFTRTPADDTTGSVP